MKGKMKKLVAFALATILVLAMGMTAFAAEPGADPGTPTSYSIYLEENATVPEGHTYKIYQIFKGTLDTTGAILSDVQYGANYKGNTAYTSPYEEAKAITDANAFAESIQPDGNPIGTIEAGQNSTTLSESGYYLVVDESTVQGEDQVSKFIVSVGGDIGIKPKYSKVPDFEKTVGENAEDKATVDYAAGDDVPFTLKATMKEDIGTYDTYQLVFTDTLSENLAFNNDVEIVYRNGDAETAYTTEDFKVETTGQNITITMANIKKDNAIANGTEIIVRYTAKLSEDIDSGEVAENEASLEYGNNGDNQGSGTTTTDEVKVYTFKLAIDKVDEDSNPLAGAGFTLYDESGNVIDVIEAADDKTEFEFKGLKAGTYRLEETTVPDGYNKMEDMTITVGAEINGTTVTPTEADGWTQNNFVYGTEITNYAGVQLPSTGGIGTTIFYVVGGILVVVAGVLLITKKRMGGRD